MRCRPTLACTLICESAWPITSCSSRAMRTRSRCSAVWRRCIASARNSAARSRRTRTNAPMPKHAASSAVVRAMRNGCQSRPTMAPSTIAATHPTTTEATVHSIAPRTMASTIAKARATYGGPTSGREQEVGEGGRGRRRRPSGRDTAASRAARAGRWRRARPVPSPAAHPTCSQTAMPIAAGTCTSRLMITGASSVTAGGGRKRSGRPSHCPSQWGRPSPWVSGIPRS